MKVEDKERMELELKQMIEELDRVHPGMKQAVETIIAYMQRFSEDEELKEANVPRLALSLVRDVDDNLKASLVMLAGMSLDDLSAMMVRNALMLKEALMSEAGTRSPLHEAVVVTWVIGKIMSALDVDRVFRQYKQHLVRLILGKDIYTPPSDRDYTYL